MGLPVFSNRGVDRISPKETAYEAHAVGYALTFCLAFGLIVLNLPSALAALPSCFGQSATKVGTIGADVYPRTSGADVIVGLGGDDQIFGLAGGDRLCGGDGNDTVDGSKGSDRATGDAGDDTILGGLGGTDRIYGAEEDDTLDGRGTAPGTDGAGIIDGGDGSEVWGDTVRYRTARRGIKVNLGAGTATKDGIDTITRWNTPTVPTTPTPSPVAA